MNRVETFRGPTDPGIIKCTFAVAAEKLSAVMQVEGDYPQILVDGVWIKIDQSEVAKAESLLRQRS